jgi:hypothetical protein
MVSSGTSSHIPMSPPHISWGSGMFQINPTNPSSIMGMPYTAIQKKVPNSMFKVTTGGDEGFTQTVSVEGSAMSTMN